MQRSRSGAGNVRFASPAGSRPTTVTSITEEQTERSRASSARTASVVGAGGGLYEIWEPPDEAVLDHYEPLGGGGGGSKTSAGTRLGQAVAAVLRSKYTDGPVSLPRFSFSRSSHTRTRSVASESDLSSLSPVPRDLIRDQLAQEGALRDELIQERLHRDELIRDAHRLGLPIRTPITAPRPVIRPVARSVTQPAVRPVARPVVAPTRPVAAPVRPVVVPPKPTVAPPRPVTAPPKPIPALPRPAPAPAPAPVIPPTPSPIPAPTPTTTPPVSRTLASALAPSTGSPQETVSPIASGSYKVWRASVARPRNAPATSPYTRMIDDAMYKPKPVPPAGTIIESGGEGVIRAEKAMYAALSERYADERIFWTMPPDHDERVRNRIQAVDKMSRELALYGLDMYLASGIKGAIMTNAGYHAPEWPDSPAYDWITFNDARKTGDKTLQESIAFTDPATTTLVFIFLVSRSGESMAIWRRKFTVPPSEQLRRNLELRRVSMEARRLGQVYEIDLNPPMMIPEDSWVVVVPERKKKRQKFPWFKVDWGK